jgi:hypothetical protein
MVEAVTAVDVLAVNWAMRLLIAVSSELNAFVVFEIATSELLSMPETLSNETFMLFDEAAMDWLSVFETKLTVFDTALILALREAEALPKVVLDTDEDVAALLIKAEISLFKAAETDTRFSATVLTLLDMLVTSLNIVFIFDVIVFIDESNMAETLLRFVTTLFTSLTTVLNPVFNAPETLTRDELSDPDVSAI